MLFTFAEAECHGSEHIRQPRDNSNFHQIDVVKTAMAYNKARAEKKWSKMEAEEKETRELGVNETIQRLHVIAEILRRIQPERRYPANGR